MKGLRFSFYTKEGPRAPCKPSEMEPFRHMTPVATAGYSIYIYHVDDSENQAARARGTGSGSGSL